MGSPNNTFSDESIGVLLIGNAPFLFTVSFLRRVPEFPISLATPPLQYKMRMLQVNLSNSLICIILDE